MASKRGPFRYDKPDANANGGIIAYSDCETIAANWISADNVDVRKWLHPEEGNLIWIRPPNTLGLFYEFRITRAFHRTTYFTIYVQPTTIGVCPDNFPNAGPTTEWFISWYDPTLPPPYDETSLSAIGSTIVESPTEPGSEVGCYVPYMDYTPPTYTRYVNAAGQEVEYWVEPQGLGHVVSVNDFSVSPPARRLYACTYFETLDDEFDENAGSAPPMVIGYEWTPIDLDYPKIDKTTGKPYNPWGTRLGLPTVSDLATED